MKPKSSTQIAIFEIKYPNLAQFKGIVIWYFYAEQGWQGNIKICFL